MGGPPVGRNGPNITSHSHIGLDCLNTTRGGMREVGSPSSHSRRLPQLVRHLSALGTIGGRSIDLWAHAPCPLPTRIRPRTPCHSWAWRSGVADTTTFSSATTRFSRRLNISVPPPHSMLRRSSTPFSIDSSCVDLQWPGNTFLDRFRLFLLGLLPLPQKRWRLHCQPTTRTDLDMWRTMSVQLAM